jgi:hypothetical protein
MQYVSVVLANPYVRGAISGFLAAAVVDFHAFMRWQSFEECATYSWKIAAFRWVQGAVAGAVAAAGLFAAS